MPDRSGGRESKGASLKQSKKNPGGVAARGKKQKVEYVPGSKPKTPPTPPSAGAAGKYFDCNAALLSRQFDADRDRTIQRARQEALSGIICWFADIGKIDELAALCETNPGFLYYLAGVHPDNVDRTNKKLHDGWMIKVDEFARNGNCVGLLSGLNLTREVGTHFAQEILFKSSYQLAASLNLPLVLYVADSKSLERIKELLDEEGWDSSAQSIIIHDILTLTKLHKESVEFAIEAGFHVTVSSTPAFFDPNPSIIESLQSCLQAIPIEKLLVCSNSPSNTPQNIPDGYIRSQRNEPSNIPFTYEAIAPLLQPSMTGNELAKAVKVNLYQVYGFEDLEDSKESPIDESKTTGDEEVRLLASSINKTSIADNNSTKVESSDIINSDYYSCSKCRKKLFSKCSIVIHEMQAAKTVFEVGAIGVCTAVLFLHVDLIDDDSTSGLLVNKAGDLTVSCSHCKAKIGKRADADVLCPCGVTVSGPILRITTAKVDLVEAKASTTVLAERSIKEAEKHADMDEYLDYEEKQKRLEHKNLKKASKKKKEKSDNKGNFSNYRNKTFVPNASRYQTHAEIDESINVKNETVEDSSDNEAEDDEN